MPQGIVAREVGAREDAGDLFALRLVVRLHEGPNVVLGFVGERPACVHVFHCHARDVDDEVRE
eukprot:2610964-Lingulodinium_polyedra.AAC.1